MGGRGGAFILWVRGSMANQLPRSSGNIVGEGGRRVVGMVES
jgi:hypothetical protein